jgi:hypothetical protein
MREKLHAFSFDYRRRADLAAAFLGADFFAAFLGAAFFADFLVAVFLGDARFTAFFAAAFFGAARFVAAFLGAARLVAAFLGDAFLADFFGAFFPSLRASLRPIAIACLRDVTFLPEPVFNLPRFISCMFSFTFLPAALEYFAMIVILVSK